MSISSIVLAAILVCLNAGAIRSSKSAEPQSPDPRSAAPAPTTIDEMYQRLVARRELQISQLREYADIGQFPCNTDFPGQLVPYFVDRVGTTCAVAHLAQQDGRDKLVASIAAHANHVRIGDLSDGPLVDWIAHSGLTQAECALIQPSYATIEDYRRSPKWQDEVTRLRTHFADVEQVLLGEAQRSLQKALLAELNAKRRQDPSSPTLSIGNLLKALESKEAPVRIAGAYALARLKPQDAPRSDRIKALQRNLADANLLVRFWTASALEEIGAASQVGQIELHRQTLPVFLAAFQSDQDDIRLSALIQLAAIAPECIGTNRQLRLIPEIRRALVVASRDDRRDVREFAKQTLESWRWQRVAYESQRMRRHYIADSYDLECLAAETLTLGRAFADELPAIAGIDQHRARMDVSDSITYMAQEGQNTPVLTADTEEQAAKIIDEYQYAVYKNVLGDENPPTWKIEAAELDASGMSYVVTAWRTDMDHGPKLLYVVPRADMLSHANASPSNWFEITHSTQAYIWPASPPAILRPRPELRIVLGKNAHNDPEAFTATCDIFAYFMTYYAKIAIDREVDESPDKLTWSGRFATLRQHAPRFFERGGGGSSSTGGGGWDFHRLTFACDRATGELTLGAEPIIFPVTPRIAAPGEPEWQQDELRLMGWKPLEMLPFFGSSLMPPEYVEAVEQFDPDNQRPATELLRRRYYAEMHLPEPSFMLALLSDKAGRRAEAIKYMDQKAAGSSDDPKTLCDIARWESSIGRYESAREHAEAALKLWPDLPAATKVLVKLRERREPEKIE